jgi:hypothetical protein
MFPPTLFHNSKSPSLLVVWLPPCWRASTEVLLMWPCKKNLISKFSYLLLFPHPTHKTKTGTTNKWETTNSNPPGPIKLSSQSTAGVRLCCVYHQPEHPMQNIAPKPFGHFAELTGRFWLFFIRFSCTGTHTLGAGRTTCVFAKNENCVNMIMMTRAIFHFSIVMGSLSWDYVTQDPPVHHPLEISCDSIAMNLKWVTL